MGKKKQKKNKHKKNKWQHLQGALIGKPYTPFKNNFLFDTYYCPECEFFLVNKNEGHWETCPNCQSSTHFRSIGKKDMRSIL